MVTNVFEMVREVGRVPSSEVPLNAPEQTRFERIMDQAVMIDVHQHPFLLPEDMDRFIEFLRTSRYQYGYQAVEAGGWSAVTTASAFSGFKSTTDMSFMEYEDIAAEVGGMLADVATQDNIVRVGNADEILAARQQGKIGFLPTLEHLAIGNRIERVDALFGMGVRLAGITYNRRNFIGDGQTERNPGGLSDFGVEVVHRMNDLGMAVDLSHASTPTAMDAIEISRAPDRVQPQRFLYVAAQRPYSKGRGIAGLRPQRRPGLHHRGAQLPERRSRAGHRMCPGPLRLHG